ncbi:hypothetical protein NLL45_04770 [Corynebacterium propinquum]|jgi:hypothetical protein|uniref:Uncharacterized protein n=1 Tax=Corynebacterium propinquum TaxID=43769 RepID=A0ABT7G292_9CORY|nr:hypothetical protein [Corynebacterium propinquum]MDK4282236.1 hypothetical protein [Corynebacterium propinquum]MDK4300847.1 hypothetical protein [Corynebacterium propinquum]MDK4313248.1 hypothetical protein [Corynebacterium propinquum]WKS32882.1 hypothetical protein NLL45_04770 [Corynebacterium propinquum]WKS37300.1 hypothetical protein NLL30_05230 [Corynebacterium propinquum]
MSYSKLAQSCIIAAWAALIVPILLMIFVDSTGGLWLLVPTFLTAAAVTSFWTIKATQ